ncbi:unnamed protein product [Rhizoctonia solani]|uniref:Uncharacterized protein n=1 Tax=Rhizoctonia solani TaxID=456999 RepID=A0A8H2XE52_9AGAM|nr:unnamed protein product [Rhizoctonia solani]
MNWYIGFQEIVTVGLTFVIDGGSSYHLVSLYLGRAGSGSLLDIDIEMRARFWTVVAIESHDWETQLDKVPYLLKFLISRGATVDRWRSLTVCAKQPEVLYAIIGFINAKPARALQSISCRWKYWHQGSEIDVDEELRSLEYPHLFSESYLFSSSMMPKLRSVEFNAVSWGYVFGRSPGPPLLTGLTNLSLTSAHFPCSASDIQNLLASNLELEHLSLSISKQAATEFHHDIDPVPSSLHVCLPKLLSLSFSTSGGTEWVSSVLSIISAPVLRRFSIAGDFMQTLSLTNHFTGGKLLLQHEHGNIVASTEDIRPTYPLLDELDISMLTMITEILLRMLFALPKITKLHVGYQHIKQLNAAPHVLPNLEHIYCSWVPYRQLGDLLRRRTNAGFPIRTVHLGRAGLDHVGELLPEDVRYEYYHALDYELDYDDSDLASNDGLGEDEDMFEDSGDDLMLMTDEVPGSSDEDDSSPSPQESNWMTMDN